MADKPTKKELPSAETPADALPPAPPAPAPRPERGGSYRVQAGALIEIEPATAPPTTEEQR